jgi:hypothetical protein
MRRAELDNARASFARLTHRPETGPVNAGSGQLTHEQLVALGTRATSMGRAISSRPLRAMPRVVSRRPWRRLGTAPWRRIGTA